MSSPKPTPRPPRRKRAPITGAHRRGDVWLVRSDPANPAVGNEIWADRPAIVLSADVMNARSGYAVVVYLTTSTNKGSSPTNVELPGFSTGKRSSSREIAICAQVHTVDASRLVRRLGVYEDSHVEKVETAVAIGLGIRRAGANAASALYSKWEKQLDAHAIDVRQDIENIAGLTADERVEALSRALALVTVQRDSWRTLYESTPESLAALAAVDELAPQTAPIPEEGP